MSHSGHPGFRVLLNNYSILYLLLQRPISGVTVGSFWPWLKKHESFKEYGLDIISVVRSINLLMLFSVIS